MPNNNNNTPTDDFSGIVARTTRELAERAMRPSDPASLTALERALEEIQSLRIQTTSSAMTDATSTTVETVEGRRYVATITDDIIDEASPHREMIWSTTPYPVPPSYEEVAPTLSDEPPVLKAKPKSKSSTKKSRIMDAVAEYEEIHKGLIQMLEYLIVNHSLRGDRARLLKRIVDGITMSAFYGYEVFETHMNKTPGIGAAKRTPQVTVYLKDPEVIVNLNEMLNFIRFTRHTIGNGNGSLQVLPLTVPYKNPNKGGSQNISCQIILAPFMPNELESSLNRKFYHQYGWYDPFNSNFFIPPELEENRYRIVVNNPVTGEPNYRTFEHLDTLLASMGQNNWVCDYYNLRLILSEIRRDTSEDNEGVHLQPLGVAIRRNSYGFSGRLGG